jgi:hypothetical protein
MRTHALLLLPLLSALALPGCVDKGSSSDDSGSDDDTGASDDDDGLPAVDPDAALVILGNGAEEIPQQSTYFETTMDGIALWSFAQAELELKNVTDAPVVIDTVRLSPADGVQPEEWLVTEAYASSRLEHDLAGTTIAPGESAAFGLYFWPVAWGERDVNVVIEYDGGRAIGFVARGRGRDPGVLLGEETLVEAVWGETGETASSAGAVADTNMAAMSADASGNVFLLSNASTWSDGFSTNMAVVSLDGDGAVRWMKEWDEDYAQSNDGDENSSEGAAGAIDVGSDGFVYTAMKASTGSSNSVYRGWVTKLDPETGAVVWSKRWLPRDVSSPLAKDNASFSAVDASGTHVLVAGYTGWYDDPEGAELASSDKLLLAAYDKATGDQVWAHVIDVHPGSSDKAQALCADGQGGAYLAGVGNNDTILAHVSGVDGSSPSLDWVNVNEAVDFGSNYRHCDTDSAGNVYLALDRGGLPTWFTAVSYGLDGSMRWAKTFNEDAAGDNNNAWVARVDGDTVYFGGRIDQGFDTVQGEGFVLAADTADGAFDWGSFYYTGKGNEEIAYHRVQGLELGPDGDLLIGHSATVVQANFAHYWGHWYQTIDTFGEDPATCGDGSGLWVDYAAETSSWGSTVQWVAVTGDQETDADASLWQDAPEKVSVDEARGREGQGVESHVLFQRIRL